MPALPADPQAVIAFWREAGPDRWFKADPDFDAAIRERFAELHAAAARGELDGWAATPEGALALVLVFDQFPRNLHRGTPQAFATDGQALAVARMALSRGDAERLDRDLNQFLALPLMHSEDLADQEDCVAWMERIGPDNLPFAIEHRDIVQRFGRFPHRNPILGRETTPEERRFLDDGGFAG
ncbi:hypothetical protein GCM10011390_36490 [Aureimonas endophytica]|uniref:DUF924 domain-containing protein n=1 Tax=Aureimonas endophytica TaxID=2027858 RepID=A0A916ZTY0_9HYPH|nr:DUF924 family protein [Aureimonas endophytica]GGE14019.1 hypothetical protein GCM10011390_36490 [Aureimonas endophytica]